ncbi:hypothetical protein ACJBZ2_11235, partial [Streptococcus suis]
EPDKTHKPYRNKNIKKPRRPVNPSQKKKIKNKKTLTRNLNIEKVAQFSAYVFCKKTVINAVKNKFKIKPK